MKHQSPKTLLAEVAEHALMYDFLRNGRPVKHDKPGDWIQRLPAAKREVLAKLKSKDIRNAMLRNQSYVTEKPSRRR